MNEIENKFLLVGDKQPSFTCSACGPFTKNKERIEKFMQTGNTDFIYIRLVFNMIWLMVNQKI